MIVRCELVDQGLCVRCCGLWFVNVSFMCAFSSTFVRAFNVFSDV